VLLSGKFCELVRGAFSFFFESGISVYCYLLLTPFGWLVKILMLHHWYVDKLIIDFLVEPI
jgi:hypothetical protein